MFTKVVTPQEMRRIESLSFEHGVKDADLMEHVGIEIANYVDTLVTENGMEKNILLLCGKGNNGADALIAGLYLIDKGFEVTALMLHQEGTPLCRSAKERFIAADGNIITPAKLSTSIQSCSLILDGIFGTGFKGAAGGVEKEVIEWINRSSQPTIAIDIPSGLDSETGRVETVAIEAQITLTLCYPKSGFFLNEGWNHVGRIETLPIGLPETFYELADPQFLLLEEDYLSAHLPPIKRNRHKYQRGTVTLLTGSSEMAGAAYLTALGAFRGGAGMVHLFVKQEMIDAFHNLPELILIPYDTLTPQEMAARINQSKAFVVGPGLGKGALPLLQNLLPLIEIPLVVDADALNNEINMPKGALLTPHHGEMARLLNLTKPPFDPQFVDSVKNYSIKKNLPILLKGAPTLFIHGKMPPVIIPFGDPGMATAGCGDLLSGIIGSFLAQGLKVDTAALLGAGIHALAGERAAEKYTSYCLKTGDIANALPSVFHQLLSN